MMISLFSVFDPVVNLWWGLSLNWLSILLVLVIYPMTMYSSKTKVEGLVKSVIYGVMAVFKEISTPNFLGVVILSVGLFMLISLNNSLGLFPFIFTGTSHLSVTFSMGLVMWFSIMMMGWIKSFKNSSAHLVPMGSPLILASFMVLIELISQLIRPITLSVRLAANMMAGHLIIGLISSISMYSVGGVFMSVLFQSMMLLLEWAVSFIQAFVFSILVMLYALEVY